VKSDYKKELRELAHLLNKTEAPTFDDGMQRFSDAFTRLNSLYLLYRYVVERRIVTEAPKGIRILYAKCTNSLLGILRCLHAGLPGPAAMLLRALFETAINLQVILKDNVEERSRLFEEYLFIERENSEVPPEMRSKNKRDADRVRGNYHPTKPYSWCWKLVPGRNRGKVSDNPTLYDLCKHIGHPEYYQSIYGSLSAAIHPVPSYEVWLMKTPGGDMELGPHFGATVGMVAQLSLVIAHDSLVGVLDYVQHPEGSDLALLSRSITGIPMPMFEGD
jgi:hypothetical protein